MSSRPQVDRVASSLSRVKIGVAHADITPPIGISANPWGKSLTAISTGVHRPLMSAALLIKAERERFLVTLDLGWIGCYECDLINFRGRVVAELGIEIDDLIVNLSQTHKGPPFCIHEAPREGAEFVPAYIEKVIITVIEICKEARSNIEEANITWAYGSCDLATVRDLPVGANDVVGYNPELLASDTLVVGRVTSIAGANLATLVNYGCHPTTMGWDSSLISPDYVGRARELIEARTGAPMFFLLGACGNVGPRIQYSGDPQVADTNGEMLGYSTLATLAGMLPPASDYEFNGLFISSTTLADWQVVPAVPNTTVKSKKILAVLAHKPLLTEDAMRANWESVTASKAALDSRIRKQFEMRIDYVKEGGKVHHPIWMWRIGDAILIAHCGEAYFEMAEELRLRHPDQIILFLDMSNGPGYVYVPTRSAYERNAYQAGQTLLAPGGFEEMLEIIDTEINNF